MATTLHDAATQVLTTAATSPEPSTKASNISVEHKRKFLETFRRWEILFKRKDGASVQAEKWLIAEYYDSLKHLSPEGFDTLTRMLKANCTFFPTIAECLAVMKPASAYDWGHPFRGRPARLFQPETERLALEAPHRPTIEDQREAEQ